MAFNKNIPNAGLGSALGRPQRQMPVTARQRHEIGLGHDVPPQMPNWAGMGNFLSGMMGREMAPAMQSLLKRKPQPPSLAPRRPIFDDPMREIQ